MLKFKFLFVFLSVFLLKGFAADSTYTVEQNSFADQFKYYHVKGKAPSDKILVFLHGGVINPVFETQTLLDLEYLIEGNVAFLETFVASGFEIFIPQKSDSLNWLNAPENAQRLIQLLIESKGQPKGEVYIGGHSDGGTGAFKIFIQNEEKYDGLLCINGYPQNGNFLDKQDFSVLRENTKNIVLSSTFKDQTIAYEFSLISYLTLKEKFPASTLYIVDGTHDFKSYSDINFSELIQLLVHQKKAEVNNFHCLVKDNQIYNFYPYRKKLFRKYEYRKEIYEENKRQESFFDDYLETNELKYPIDLLKAKEAFNKFDTD